jgi:CheY-like chemotaxis protein
MFLLSVFHQPLSAYVSGMELITSILPDIYSNLHPLSECSISIVREKLSEVGETIQNMRTVNEFMMMTINRCIDYTKSSQGLKLVPRMETINFVEAVALPLNCMRNLQDKTVEVNLLPISPEIGKHVITDKQWLQENILCLLSNAVKYSTGGTATVSVSLLDSEQAARLSQAFGAERQSVSSSVKSAQADVTSPMIRIDIEDTGIGIAPSAMKALFAPFNQAQRMAGGTGLGLYSLARRVEALKGLYGVSRRRDGQSGSLFWFAIPYRPDDTMVAQPNMRASVSTVSASASAATSARTSFNLNSSMEAMAERVALDTIDSRSSNTVEPFTKDVILNILVVDDSPAILKMSSRMLRQLGHRVTTAVNGADAVQKINAEMDLTRDEGEDQSEGYFDVVLMDLQMPVMDGLEATSRIRSQEVERTDIIVLMAKQLGRSSYSPTHSHPCALHQVIIGVSANSDNETMEAAFAAGIDAFIAKPFTMQSFKETYNTLCQKRDHGTQ